VKGRELMVERYGQLFGLETPAPPMTATVDQ